MKVRYAATGGIMESDNEFVVDQWRKYPDLYEETPEFDEAKQARKGRLKEEKDEE